jgi:SsrA-binding protein
MPKGLGKVIAQNKKAHHDYYIEDTYEAGIVLKGSEIKSIRTNKVTLNDAFVNIFRGEAYVNNMHIAPYEFETKQQMDPTRARKLLLHKKEIARLIGLQKQEGYSVIPLKLYLKDGYAKVLIGVAKGKKNYDKREDLKKKDSDRQIERALKDRNLNR